jgi:Zn-dependent alcohol dehydrogenase
MVGERRYESARAAKDFGATHTINSRENGAVEGVQALTDGNGANVVVDAVGCPETFTQAFYAPNLAGTWCSYTLRWSLPHATCRLVNFATGWLRFNSDSPCSLIRIRVVP